MGIVDVIPGVSGATIALIIGIYERIIDAIKDLNIKYLIPIFIGILCGWLAGVHVILYFYDLYPSHMFAFFFGLILALIPRPLRECKERGMKEVFMGILGFLISFFIVGICATQAELEPWYILICGFLAITAMMIPGMSGSMVLLILGAYIPIMGAVKGFFHLFIEFDPTIFTSEEFMIVLIFGIGALIGLFVMVNVFSSLIKRYRYSVMPFFVGLILGSLRAVIPGEISPSVIVSFLVGVSFVLSLSLIESRNNLPIHRR